MGIKRRDFPGHAAAGSAIATMPTFLTGCGVNQAIQMVAPVPEDPFMQWLGVDEALVTGSQSLAELLGDVGEGVYVTSWLGGNAEGTTCDYSLGLRGHMIEKGEIGRPVGEMNVTGNLRDLFTRLEAVGNDPYPYSGTLAPSLVFADVDFSGA